MVKCEAELYQRLKVFAFDNNWGGKNGSRNAWVTSMKDYAFDFQTVREGLLTLENAFFELMGGSKDDSEKSQRSGKELLEDPSTREDIELESIDTNISGLWNSRASRNVFIEIVSSKFLSLLLSNSGYWFLPLPFRFLCLLIVSSLFLHSQRNRWIPFASL
jgi:hypothetical protein